MPDAQEHIDRLTQRRNWLTARIAAKQSVGWDVTYDISERDALTWALDRLQLIWRNPPPPPYDIGGLVRL